MLIVLFYLIFLQLKMFLFIAKMYFAAGFIYLFIFVFLGPELYLDED